MYEAMGSLDTPFEAGGGMAVNLPADIYVVANAAVHRVGSGPSG